MIVIKIGRVSTAEHPLAVEICVARVLRDTTHRDLIDIAEVCEFTGIRFDDVLDGPQSSAMHDARIWRESGPAAQPTGRFTLTAVPAASGCELEVGPVRRGLQLTRCLTEYD